MKHEIRNKLVNKRFPQPSQEPHRTTEEWEKKEGKRICDDDGVVVAIGGVVVGRSKEHDGWILWK